MFDYAIRREAHIFGPGIVFVFFLLEGLGARGVWYNQRWGDWLYRCFFLTFSFLWTSSWCVIGVENVDSFSPGYFFSFFGFFVFCVSICVRLAL